MKVLKVNRKKKRINFPWRFAITALLIVLQILISFGFMALLGKEYIWIEILFFVEGLLVLFFIVNKHQPASYKLPWVILILFAPLTGIFAYIAFSESKMPKKAKKRYEMDIKESNYYLEECEGEIFDDIKKVSKDGLEISKYIKNETGAIPYKNCACKYLSSGEKFFESLKAELKKAKEFILMEYFIISDSSMLDEIMEILEDRKEHGVKIYIMYDDIGSLKISHKFDKQCRKKGINCYKFNPFHPVITALHNNRDHRKITVIDGKVAFTGGANIADEYINRITLHGHWKDCAVKIEGEAVRSFVAMFVQLYNLFAHKTLNVKDFLTDYNECSGKAKIAMTNDEKAEEEDEKKHEEKCKAVADNHIFSDENCDIARPDTDIFANSDAPTAKSDDTTVGNDEKDFGFVQPFGSGPKPLYEREVGQDTFLNIINTAKDYLYITTPYLIVDYSVSKALENAAIRGVDVRIITPHIPDKKAVFIMTRSSYMPLVKAGVKIYEYGAGFIHTKTIVCDDEIAFVGTINFDYRSFVHHFECGAIFIKNPIISDIKEDICDTIKKDGILQTENTAKLNFMQKIIKNIANIFAPLL